MKAQLITITEEMTGSTELAEALNQNFNSLNDMAHKREMAIFNRMNEMEANIIAAIERRIVPTEKRVIAIMRHMGLDPNKDLLTEEN